MKRTDFHLPSEILFGSYAAQEDIVQRRFWPNSHLILVRHTILPVIGFSLLIFMAGASVKKYFRECVSFFFSSEIARKLQGILRAKKDIF